MSELNIEELGFKPVKKAPSQPTFNGIGVRLYGQNKLEGAAPLYTKVLYFTIFYIPILALGKYLAYKENGSEFILGKGKLSGLSKGWNCLLVAIVLSFVGSIAYSSHVKSPEYIAKKLYKDANTKIEAGKFGPAIDDLNSIYIGRSSLKQTAKDKLEQLMSAEYLSKLSPQENYEVIANATQKTSLFPNKLPVFIDNFNKFETVSPEAASGFADLIVMNTRDEEQIQFYENKSHQLLKGLYAKNTSDFGISQKYALLEERLNQCERCLSILEPHFKKLAGTESARVLGQAYADVRETDKAYELLDPYVEKHIKRYHAAEKRYDDEIQKVWDSSIKFLNSGKASSVFYDEYDAASKEDQQAMVDEYYYEKRDNSRLVAIAKQEYLDSTSVVPVALDLGIVLLDKAGITRDSSEREKLLEKAEKTFLSVQNYAGDSDDYQLYLGQVYYWLNKEEEGDKLFEALLNKYGRSHQVLSSISSTMRNLGAFTKAREYAVEAYDSATQEADKKQYAQSLALLSDDLTEKIEWLSKADQTNLYVKGDLLSAKGRKASEDNKTNEALNYLQQSIEVYQKIPESATQLNNVALIYLTKYRISFDSSDLGAVLVNMDKALALAPEDSIVLGNTAFQYLAKSYLDILSSYIDFKALEWSPGINTFSYVYDNDAQKNEIRQQLRNNSSFKKGLGYLEKAALLAPKNKSFFDGLFEVYSFMEDEEGLSRLVSRFDGLELDLDGQEKRLQDYRSGASHEESLTSTLSYIKQNLESSQTQKNKANKYNQAILRSYFISSKMNLALYGKPGNPTELLGIARENYKSVASSSTRSDLESVLVHYLLLTAESEVAGFNDFTKKYRNIYTEDLLFILSLNQVDEFKQFVLNKVEGKELVSLMKLSLENFPSSPNVTDWKVFDELSRESALEMAKAFTASSTIKHKYALGFKQTSNQEYIHYIQVLEQEVLSDDKQAAKINQAAIQNGLLLPELKF